MDLHCNTNPSTQITVSDFIAHDKTWDIPKLMQLPPEQLVRKIMVVLIRVNDVQDWFCQGRNDNSSTKLAT